MLPNRQFCFLSDLSHVHMQEHTETPTHTPPPSPAGLRSLCISSVLLSTELFSLVCELLKLT